MESQSLFRIWVAKHASKQPLGSKTSLSKSTRARLFQMVIILQPTTGWTRSAKTAHQVHSVLNRPMWVTISRAKSDSIRRWFVKTKTSATTTAMTSSPMSHLGWGLSRRPSRPCLQPKAQPRGSTWRLLMRQDWWYRPSGRSTYWVKEWVSLCRHLWARASCQHLRCHQQEVRAQPVKPITLIKQLWEMEWRMAAMLRTKSPRTKHVNNNNLVTTIELGLTSSLMTAASKTMPD